MRNAKEQYPYLLGTGVGYYFGECMIIRYLDPYGKVFGHLLLQQPHDALSTGENLKSP